MLRERPVGALNVNRKPGREEFTEQDVRTLSIFASQAASAIEKAQLYRRGQEELERSQQMLAKLEQTQAQLIQSEKMASLGLLAGGVAHEINNPLTVIRGRTELMLASTPGDAPVRKSLDLVLTESDRIAKIVRGLLDFSREHGSREMTLINLNHVVEQTLELTSHIMKVENVEIVTELEAELPMVLANAGRLQQVFMNVAVNALQAMPQGGKLHVRTWPGETRVHVSFADTGCGIPEDVLPRIFEPFFTTKAEGEGTGLGLAVSHGIMKAHGGDINIHSVAGEGTVVTIDLPVAHAQ
jgi:two-component system NtrC family sensor kinase